MKREVLNKLLLLKLVDIAGKLNERKLNQLVFILQNEGRREAKRTFNYEFIKWNIEPLSEELQKDVQYLLFEKLLKNEHGLCLSNKGAAFLKHSAVQHGLENVDSFFKFYIYVYINYPLYELTDAIYRKYEVGCRQDKEIISGIGQFEIERPKLKLEEARQRVHGTYEELEQNEAQFAEKIRSFLEGLNSREEKRENGG